MNSECKEGNSWEGLETSKPENQVCVLKCVDKLKDTGSKEQASNLYSDLETVNGVVKYFIVIIYKRFAREILYNP